MDTLSSQPQCPGALHRNIPWGIQSHPDVNPYNPDDPQHSSVCPSLYGLLSLTNFKIVTAGDKVLEQLRLPQLYALSLKRYEYIGIAFLSL